MYAAVIPFRRAFYTIEVNYNEGWNTYNAYQVVHHAQLYATKYGWKPVNLSGVLLCGDWRTGVRDPRLSIHRENAFTSWPVGLLLADWRDQKKATGMLIPAIISGLFCLAVFLRQGRYLCRNG